MNLRIILLLLWTVPVVVYCILLALRPHIMGDDYSAVYLGGIMDVGQPFITPLVIMLTAFFSTANGRRQQTLTKDRFQVACFVFLMVHALFFIYFMANVYLIDYAEAETCSEMLPQRLHDACNLATFVAAFAMIPVKFLYER